MSPQHTTRRLPPYIITRPREGLARVLRRDTREDVGYVFPLGRGDWLPVAPPFDELDPAYGQRAAAQALIDHSENGRNR